MTNEDNIYNSGEYLEKNPTWHLEDSAWKAGQILKMLARNRLAPKSICEVGCGAGEILRQLQLRLGPEAEFCGYEISRQAFDLCKTRENPGLHFKLQDITGEKEAFFDLILLIDLIEHLEDYFDFLRKVKPKSNYKILHIPLDLNVKALLRVTPLLEARQSVGHIHLFNKEWALAVLRDTGYDRIDWFYTRVDTPPVSLRGRLTRPLRDLFYRMQPDLAVRVLDGYSLMVLVK